MVLVRLKKRSAVHRQKSGRLDNENPLGRRGCKIADQASPIAGVGSGRSRRTKIVGGSSEDDLCKKIVAYGQGIRGEWFS